MLDRISSSPKIHPTVKTVHQRPSQRKSTSTLGFESSRTGWRSVLSTHVTPWIVLGILVSIGGCQPGKQGSDTVSSDGGNSTNTIIATSYPIEWVTEQIVGDEYSVKCPAGSADQPDRWRPDRKTISEIQASDMIVCNGIVAPYASWMETVSLPTSKVIQSASKGMTLADYISVDDIQVVHTHGPEGEHSHPTMVSRTWLDPAMLIKQANYIAEQLSKRSPNNAAQFQGSLASVVTELESIIPERLPEQTPPVFSATPELKFLTRAAGVADLHFNWNEKTTLEQAETDLASRKQAESTKFILFPQRLDALAERLQPAFQKQKLTPIFIDMLDRDDSKGDFITRLGENFKRLKILSSSER